MKKNLLANHASSLQCINTVGAVAQLWRSVCSNAYNSFSVQVTRRSATGCEQRARSCHSNLQRVSAGSLQTFAVIFLKCAWLLIGFGCVSTSNASIRWWIIGDCLCACVCCCWVTALWRQVLLKKHSFLYKWLTLKQ